MSGSCLVSLRSTHSSPLLPALVLNLLKQIERDCPALPIHICYECDSDFELSFLIDAYTQATPPRYQDASVELCQLGIAHDKALLQLLKFIQEKNYHFVTTDLKGINQVPLGSQRARDLLPDREEHMAKCLSNVIASESGLILDIGGFVHQGNLKQIIQTTHPLLAARYISMIPARDERVNASEFSKVVEKNKELEWFFGSVYKKDHEMIMPLIRVLIAWLQSLLTPAPALIYTDTAKTLMTEDAVLRKTPALTELIEDKSRHRSMSYYSS